MKIYFFSTYFLFLGLTHVMPTWDAARHRLGYHPPPHGMPARVTAACDAIYRHRGRRPPPLKPPLPGTTCASLLPSLLMPAKRFGRSPFLDHDGSKTQNRSSFIASVERSMDQLHCLFNTHFDIWGTHWR
jgi:hypothetical protein